ncbi:MAG: hypothetical protein NVSMB18_35020 [Acetobacteraceae bacterium]
MLFVVQFEDIYADQPERLPERAEHMAAHLAFLAEHSDRVIAAGALRPTADDVPSGGIWIINADSKAAVEAIYRDDPFWKADLRKSVQVSHWAKAHWSPAFTQCMAATDLE